MGNNHEQSIKGDNNSQSQWIVNGNINLGLQKEDVIRLIQSYCPDKEQIIDIVKEQIESIEENQRKMPDKRVFVPLIQQLSYSLDDGGIKEAYQFLLRSSMDKRKSIHPSFVSIISQLTSDEIKILHCLPPVTALPKPLIDVRMIVGEKMGGGIIIIKNFSDIGYGICDNPGNICSYIENLDRLKLIEIPPLQKIMDKSYYTTLKQHPAVLDIIKKSAHVANVKFEYDEKLFYLTQYGLQFIQACTC